MNYTKFSNEEIVQKLKSELTPKRYEHSLGTAEYSKMLAHKFGLNEDKAYIAGLLHDCAKCYSNDELLEIINKHLDIEDSEKISYKTWHAPVSAYVAQKEYGVKDTEIWSAIRWHTIGKIDMTTFEKIIFIADKVELRTRDEEYRKDIVKYLNNIENLDKAMLVCYKQTIKSLVDRDLKICADTIEIYNHFEDITKC